MTKGTRIRNITRGFSLKRNQAIQAVENCAAEWVTLGSTIRDLTLAESIAKRNEQAAQREPLPLAELHGLLYVPAHLSNRRIMSELIADAARFVASGHVIEESNA